MIYSLLFTPQTFVHPLALEMHESNQMFFLTGSRLYGAPRINSDWDYDIVDSGAVRELLTQLGFSRIVDTNTPAGNLDVNPYADGTTNAVWAAERCGTVIHIILVKDSYNLRIRHAVVRFLQKTGIFCIEMPRPQKKNIWRELIALARASIT